MTYHTNQQSGFTLVETLVSITILLIVIIGPMTISAISAKSTSFSSEQVVAFFLAQEGAELAQKGRDDILLNGFTDPDAAWASFVSTYATCFDARGCGLELNTDDTGTLKTPRLCSVTAGVNNCQLYYSGASSRSRYTYITSGNTKTLFIRAVMMQSVGNGSVRVTSRVTWRTGSQKNSQQAEVETYLFNVYGN